MKDLITTKDLVDYFGVSQNTINNWRRAGMPYIRKSRKTIRYVMEDVLDWYKNRGVMDSRKIDIIDIIDDFSEKIRDIKANIELIKLSKSYSQETKNSLIEQNNLLIRSIRSKQLQNFFECAVRLPFDFTSIDPNERGKIVEIMRKDSVEMSDSDLYTLFGIVLKE